MKISALSLWQPWATLVALELKRYETRHWDTRYRGPLAIHSAKKRDASLIALVEETQPFNWVLRQAGYGRFDDLPLGVILAFVDLVAIHRVEDVRHDLSPVEWSFGDFGDGRYAWELANVRRLERPIPARGHQSVWRWEVPQPFRYLLEEGADV